MVVMVVADEDDINGRQLLKRDARTAHAAWSAPLHRTRSLRPDRIGQHVDAAELQKERRVIDECERDLVGGQARRRWRMWRIVDPFRPRLFLARQRPAQHLPQTAFANVTGIVKATTVEMIRHHDSLRRTTRRQRRCSTIICAQWLAVRLDVPAVCHCHSNTVVFVAAARR